MKLDEDGKLICWRCPKCGGEYELGEEAWLGLPPIPGSPAVCPADGCDAVELDVVT